MITLYGNYPSILLLSTLCWNLPFYTVIIHTLLETTLLQCYYPHFVGNYPSIVLLYTLLETTLLYCYYTHFVGNYPSIVLLYTLCWKLPFYSVIIHTLLETTLLYCYYTHFMETTLLQCYYTHFVGNYPSIVLLSTLCWKLPFYSVIIYDSVIITLYWKLPFYSVIITLCWKLPFYSVIITLCWKLPFYSVIIHTLLETTLLQKLLSNFGLTVQKLPFYTVIITLQLETTLLQCYYNTLVGNYPSIVLLYTLCWKLPFYSVIIHTLRWKLPFYRRVLSNKVLWIITLQKGSYPTKCVIHTHFSWKLPLDITVIISTLCWKLPFYSVIIHTLLETTLLQCVST